MDGPYLKDLDAVSSHYLAYKSQRSEALRLFDAHENTPLHVAVEQNDIATIKIVIEDGADVNVRGSDRRTPLHFAVQRNALEAIKLLLKHGTDVNSADVSGCVPLHLANSHPEAFELLIKNGADIDSRCVCGYTPLFFAFSVDATKNVELLINNGADIYAKTATGMTALLLAIAEHAAGALEILLEQGLDQEYLILLYTRTSIEQTLDRTDSSAAELELDGAAARRK